MSSLGNATRDDEAPDFADGEWLTTEQALRRLPYSRATFDRIVNRGTLPVYRVPGTRRRMFRAADVEGLIARFRETT
jgi:excisionase family DNA binding protein